VFSALGEPLKAEIEVFATVEEAQSLQTRLAGAEAFRQANVEYLPVLNALKFSTVKERGGRRYIQVSSDRPLNEPFVDMLVELNWAAGRLVREYTFLLDPPNLSAQQPTPSIAPAFVAAPAAPAANAVSPEPISSTAEASTAPPPPVAAPSSMTSKAPSKQKSPQPAAEQKRYTVAPGDTLSKIAEKNLSGGVTLEQMLVALFRGNESAFSGKNMNRMRAGKILLIPEVDVAASVPVGEARKEVVAQAADFNAYRQKLAAVAAQAAAAPEPAATQADSGKIVPKVAEPAAPPAAGKDKLEVSRTEAGKDGKAKEGRVAALEEDLVARDKALKEANERSAALEKQLADMKKLVELKSQAGSALQAQAAKPAESMPPVAPAKPEDKIAAPAAAASETSPAASVEPVKPADSTPPPAAKPKKKKVVPPPPPPEPTFMEENGSLVFGGGGVLALLLGWLGFKTWKQRKSAVIDEDGDAEFAAYSSLSTPRENFPLPSEQQPSRFSETVVPPPIDVLAEADTFLAFGRDAQAEEVLQAALEHEPERHAIYLKLLDIYAARKSKSDFGATAKRLHALTNGEGDDWDKAAAMGAALDPDNPLYGAPTVAVSQPAPAAVAAAAAMPRMDEPPAVPEPPPSVIDFDITSAVESTPASAIEPLTAEVPDTNILDFDLDLGAATDAAPTAAEAAPMLDLSLPDVPADSGTKDANSIDFDFDLNLDTPAVADAVSPEPTFDVTGGSGNTGGDNPEVATKLELAAAYEEMGDRDGARELYQEALAEGSPAQQETARAKLAALG
jgi:pilus assembly protein FimV